MSYSIRQARKRGAGQGQRWLVVEDGTPNVAIHTKEREAQSSLRALESGKARFCACGCYILGVPGRVGAHQCLATGRWTTQDGETI